MSYLYPGEMCIRKKKMKIPKGHSKAISRRRTDNTMAKKKKNKKTNNDLQNRKHKDKTKDRVTRTRVLWNGKQFLLHVRRPSCECQQNIHIFIRCRLHF